MRASSGAKFQRRSIRGRAWSVRPSIARYHPALALQHELEKYNRHYFKAVKITTKTTSTVHLLWALGRYGSVDDARPPADV